jgi:hypothetical protein
MSHTAGSVPLLKSASSVDTVPTPEHPSTIPNGAMSSTVSAGLSKLAASSADADNTPERPSTIPNGAMSTTVASVPARSNASRREIPTLDYPSTIPDGAQVVVPAPVESYPEWTTDHHRFDGKSPTFSEIISLRDPLEHPAYYAAAADTIWLTNMRLESHAPYHPDALTKPILDEFVE